MYDEGGKVPGKFFPGNINNNRQLHGCQRLVSRIDNQLHLTIFFPQISHDPAYFLLCIEAVQFSQRPAVLKGLSGGGMHVHHQILIIFDNFRVLRRKGSDDMVEKD